MKLRAVLSLTTLGMIVSGCSTARESAPGGAPAPRDGAAADGASSTIRAVYEFGMGFGTTRDAIRGRLGVPERAEVELAENRHDAAAIDSLFTLHYPGLSFRLNRPGPVDRDLLTDVLLTDRERELPGGIRPGRTTRAELEQVLGAPDTSTTLADTSIVMHTTPNPGAEEFVQFYLVDDVVDRVRWIPYVD